MPAARHVTPNSIERPDTLADADAILHLNRERFQTLATGDAFHVACGQAHGRADITWKSISGRAPQAHRNIKVTVVQRVAKPPRPVAQGSISAAPDIPHDTGYGPQHAGIAFISTELG